VHAASVEVTEHLRQALPPERIVQNIGRVDVDPQNSMYTDEVPRGAARVVKFAGNPAR
jgi:hypothetical protein